MGTSQATQTIHAASTAFHQASRLGSIAARANTSGATAYRRRTAREAFAASLTDLVAYEDRHGVEYVAWVADLLTRSRQDAMAVGLLSPEDVCRIEAEVCC